MAAAPHDAGVDGSEVGYINAHGTGTIIGDRVETMSIRRVFRESATNIPISSTKVLHGLVMGATGAIEFAIAALALHNGVVPHSTHLDYPDPHLELDFAAEGARRNLDLRAVASDSFAFGGTNAVLVARKASFLRTPT